MMTRSDLRNEVIRRFHIGQTIILKKRDRDGVITGTRKVKILEFYPFHVLTTRKRFKECYTYWDVLDMTKEPETTMFVIPENLRKKKRGCYGHKCNPVMIEN